MKGLIQETSGGCAAPPDVESFSADSTDRSNPTVPQSYNPRNPRTLSSLELGLHPEPEQPPL